MCSQQRLAPRRRTHQEAIEELVDKEAQHAHQDIGHVIQERHVQDDGPIASGERATVPDETHQKHDFIAKLRGGTDEI